MTVVLTMQDGNKIRLDRRLIMDNVANEINECRGNGKLIRFELDLTPTGQYIWVDPDQVITVLND